MRRRCADGRRERSQTHDNIDGDNQTERRKGGARGEKYRMNNDNRRLMQETEVRVRAREGGRGRASFHLIINREIAMGGRLRQLSPVSTQVLSYFRQTILNKYEQ